MKGDWLFLTNLDQNSGFPNIFPTNSQLSGLSLLSHYSSLMDNSNLALRETITRLNKVTGAFLLWLSSGTHTGNFQTRSRVYQSQINRLNSCMKTLSNDRNAMKAILDKFLNVTVGRLWKGLSQNHSYGVLSLAAAIVPPFDNLSSKVLADSVSLGNFVRINGFGDFSHGENCRACARIPIPNITWEKDTVEPKTGIKFPTFLENTCNFATEMLVGTGSKSLTVMRLKSLKVYAFGLYIRPDSLCEKLGTKYSSVPISELKNHPDFFRDLLREDIHMTVRLVVNWNGLSINKVRDTFEKSLRLRLQKMNPETDYCCLNSFGSYFSQDIRIPMGTTIDFRQTAEGQLITEIDGRHIGAVQSKDLCRAFFDMYIGEVPVSIQAKQEIAQNVGGLIRRC